MHLYLIRHAHAEDGDDDAARPLSAKGRAQIRQIGGLLREARAIDVAEFWHSPLVRSQETATRLARRLGCAAPLREVSGLKPYDDPAAFARKLGDARRSVAVVGHEPHLSLLATLLLDGRAERPLFKMKKCAVLRLDRVGGGWGVRWLVSPELL